MNFDLGTAGQDFLRVLGTIALTGLFSLLGWRSISKTRAMNAGDDGERSRLQDAINDAKDARKDARDAAAALNAVQSRLGHLEAETSACERENKELRERLTRVEQQNERQAKQIEDLIRRNQQTDLGRNL